MSSAISGNIVTCDFAGHRNVQTPAKTVVNTIINTINGRLHQALSNHCTHRSWGAVQNKATEQHAQPLPSLWRWKRLRCTAANRGPFLATALKRGQSCWGLGRVGAAGRPPKRPHANVDEMPDPRAFRRICCSGTPAKPHTLAFVPSGDDGIRDVIGGGGGSAWFMALTPSPKYQKWPKAPVGEGRGCARGDGGGGGGGCGWAVGIRGGGRGRVAYPDRRALPPAPPPPCPVSADCPWGRTPSVLLHQLSVVASFCCPPPTQTLSNRNCPSPGPSRRSAADPTAQRPGPNPPVAPRPPALRVGGRRPQDSAAVAHVGLARARSVGAGPGG